MIKKKSFIFIFKHNPTKTSINYITFELIHFYTEEILKEKTPRDVLDSIYIK